MNYDLDSNRRSERQYARSREALFDDFAQYVNPSFVKLLKAWGYGREFVRAKDVWMWDRDGNRYLDMLSGFGVANIGHNHPDVQDAITRFLSLETVQFNHIAPNIYQTILAKKIASIVPEPLQYTIYSNSGAEAVEAAMKLARVATKRTGFVYCRNAYHGTTLATLSIMGNERLRKPLSPLLDHCVAVDFNNLPQLQAALEKENVAAFIVEPIQGEGGLNIPDHEYLQGAAKLCKRHKTVLVVDEIQTGLGRTGDMFAFQSSGIVPDVLLIGKSLSGGLLPIAVATCSKKWFKKAFARIDRFDMHSSTFSGNSMACYVGNACLQLIERENLLENSTKRGEQLLKGLKENLSGHPFVHSIRGRGLYVAIEFGNALAGMVNWFMARTLNLEFKQIYGQWIALKLLEAGIICQPAASQWNVIKLMPPLSIGEKEIATAIDTIAKVINQYDNASSVIKESTLRLLARRSRHVTESQV